MTDEMAIQLADAVRNMRCRIRIKSKGVASFQWDWPLFSPVRGYLETGKSGPMSLSVLECLDIERVEQRHRGHLVAPAIVDHGEEIEALLTKLGLAFSRHPTFYRIANQ